MLSKVLAFGGLLAAANAAEIYGAAVSSQSIIRHDETYDPLHHALPIEHIAPLVHAAPALHHAVPYATPVAPHVTPIIPYATPLVPYVAHDTYDHPKYEFAYSVADPHTGVHYTADDHNGFTAVMHSSQPSIHPYATHY